MKLIIVVIIGIFMPFLVSSQPLMHPFNLDFEEGETGRMPRGWSMPSYAVNFEYSAGLTDVNSKSGKYNLELYRYKEFKDNIYGSVMQSVDASQYRGKTIKFGAWLRAEIDGPKGSAHLWIIEYLPEDEVGFYDMMENQPVIVNEWKYYEITFYVNNNAQYLNFGAMLKGNGKAWIDGVSFDVLDKPKTYAPPKSLTEREKENLFAFAKLYSYVRYFSPSTEAMGIDWDEIAIEGAKKSGLANNDEQLVKSLNEIFSELSPALKVYQKKLAPEKYYYTEKPKEAITSAAVAWLHIGAPTVKESKLTSSKLVNIYVSQRKVEGTVIQTIDEAKVAGKRVKFSIFAKANLVKPAGRAEIRLFPEFGDKKEDMLNSVNNMALLEITDTKWKEYSLELNVPNGIRTLRIGLTIVGDGDIYFDESKLFVKDGDEWKNLDLRNAGFEDGNPGKLVRGWRMIPLSEQGGYYAEVTEIGKHVGNMSLKISSDQLSRITMPNPGEIVLGDLSNSVGFSLPICLYVDSIGTLPHSSTKIEKPSINNDRQVSGNDRYDRIGIFVQAWSLFRQFGIYEQTSQNWDLVFNQLIEKVSMDVGEWEFLQTLKLLSSNLSDGLARVWHGEENFTYGLPFLIKSIGSELIIGKVSPNYGDVGSGDKIIAINGKPTTQYLKEASKYISSESKGWTEARAIAVLRAGKENSLVKMKIKSIDGSEKDLEVHRTAYLSDLNEIRLPEVSKVNNDVFYVDLTRIDDKELKYLVDTLRSVKNIIFDMRGTVRVSEHALGLFLKANVKSIVWELPVYSKPDKKGMSQYQILAEIKAKGTLAGVRPIFLQDSRSIGYSEAILSIVKHYEIGKLVGSPTAGTIGEVSGFSLQGNYGFSWSSIIARDFENNYIRGGVKPDILIEPTIEGIRDNRDEILEAAMDMIEGIIKK